MPPQTDFMENKKLNGHIVVFSANLIFGMNTPISRSLMPEILSPYALTFFRLAGGMLLFWAVSVVAGNHGRVDAKPWFFQLLIFRLMPISLRMQLILKRMFVGNVSLPWMNSLNRH